MSVALHAAALWAGLLILWMLALSGLVVRRRRKHLVAFGDGGQAEMTTATRAFGNAAEYIPAALVALVLLAVVGAPPLLIHALGGTLLGGAVVPPTGSAAAGSSGDIFGAPKQQFRHTEYCTCPGPLLLRR